MIVNNQELVAEWHRWLAQLEANTAAMNAALDADDAAEYQRLLARSAELVAEVNRARARAEDSLFHPERRN